MKQAIFNLILSIAVLFAASQHASAQWTSNASTVYLDAANTNKNVGIGTASATQKLQLKNGNMLFDYANGTGAGSNLYFGGITNSSQNGMRLSFYNSTGTGFKNGYIDVHTNGGTTTDGLLFRVDGGAAGIGGTERMRIVAASGNVGIGISDPKQKLHVASGIMISGPNPGGGPMLLFSENVANNAYPFGRWGIEYVPNLTDAKQSGLNFWKPYSNPGQVGGPAGNAGNYYLFLTDKEGKVGMGVDPNPANCTLAPNGPFPAGFRLYVREGILTERLKIANYCSANWADYVFASDYKLKPLSEVEAFVKENKHLPNVPSAQDIENEGLDVANMLAKQMEKIEELTLYMIEMKKEIETLKSENKALKTATANRQN